MRRNSVTSEILRARYFRTETREHQASVRGTSRSASTFFMMES